MLGLYSVPKAELPLPITLVVNQVVGCYKLVKCTVVSYLNFDWATTEAQMRQHTYRCKGSFQQKIKQSWITLLLMILLFPAGLSFNLQEPQTFRSRYKVCLSSKRHYQAKAKQLPRRRQTCLVNSKWKGIHSNSSSSSMNPLKV